MLDGNPLDDIRSTENIRWVVLNGRVYEGERLDEVGPRPRPRAPFFWEDEASSVTPRGETED